jgi:hypothetical protein
MSTASITSPPKATDIGVSLIVSHIFTYHKYRE